MSQRHTAVVVDEQDRLLDAARECVLAVGVRRTTVTDVARRAGVSRMTLYRRFPDLEAVLAALMTREFGRLVAEAAERAAGRDRARARRRDGRARLPRARRRPAVRAAARRRPGAAAPVRDAAGSAACSGSRWRPAPRRSPPATARCGPTPRPRCCRPAIELIARGFVLAAHGELEPGSIRGPSWRGRSTGTCGHERVAERGPPARRPRAAGGRRGRRRRRRRRRHHRRRRRARRRLARPVGRAARAARPRVRHEPLELEARARRPAVPPARRRRAGLGVRGRARHADAHGRAAPRPAAALPDPARRLDRPPRRRADDGRPAGRRRAAGGRAHEPPAAAAAAARERARGAPARPRARRRAGCAGRCCAGTASSRTTRGWSSRSPAPRPPTARGCSRTPR